MASQTDLTARMRLSSFFVIKTRIHISLFVRSASHSSQISMKKDPLNMRTAALYPCLNISAVTIVVDCLSTGRPLVGLEPLRAIILEMPLLTLNSTCADVCELVDCGIVSE